MKRMLMVLMMVFGLSAVFAYEPKVECAKVKRNGDIKYFEKTELYDIYGLEPDPKDLCRWYNLYSGSTYDYDSWVIWKEYTVEQCVDYNYGNLERLRDSYYYFMKKANQPEPSNTSKVFTDAINAISGTNITPEEFEINSCLSLAELRKRTAIISIPFVTEENFLTLTKEEMLAKMYDFIEDVKATK